MFRFLGGFAVGVLVCLLVLFFNIIANYDPGSQGYVQPKQSEQRSTVSSSFVDQMDKIVSNDHNLRIPADRIRYIEDVRSLQPSYRDKQLYPRASAALITVKLQCREIEDVSKCVDLSLAVIQELTTEMR